MGIMWFAEDCVNCGECNMVYNGDTNDWTVQDVEGFICWSCKTSNSFSEDGEPELSDEDYFDDGEQWDR